jgi:hypothetical protein
MTYIKAETASRWECRCGNTPIQQGFFPCDKWGRLVEPTPEEWTGIYSRCDQCGRIIDQRSLRVVGRRADRSG